MLHHFDGKVRELPGQEGQAVQPVAYMRHFPDRGDKVISGKVYVILTVILTRSLLKNSRIQRRRGTKASRSGAGRRLLLLASSWLRAETN